MRAVLSKIGILLLLLTTSIFPARADQPCPSREAGPVPYPEAATSAKSTGVIKIEAEIDVCGRVIAARIAQGNGDPTLETALLDAARSWVVAPDGSDPSLPDGAPDGLLGHVPSLPAGSTVMPGVVEIPIVLGRVDGVLPVFELFQWARMRVSPIELLPSGEVPGYVGDPMPIAPATFAETMSLLSRFGERVSPPNAAVQTYELRDGFLTMWWDVFDKGFDFAPSAIRFRWASDGQREFVVASILCEAPDRSACARLEGLLQKAQPQQARPPAPAPPVSMLEEYGY